jgi:pantoate--beta-alanine ligase
MKIVNTVKGLQESLKKQTLKPVAFVPTMGALHEGHLALVEMAISKSPLVVVSIFVNPTQFNDKNDLKNYPRNIEKDSLMLGKILREDDILFAPGVEEIYPEEDKRVFHFGNLDKVMEAKQRPGHFNGVAQVVSRLFSIVNPDIAIFGQKDFQQLAVIRSLVNQLALKIRIIGHPIVREADGLAMSSRNQLLEPQIRKNAPVIYNTMSEAAEMIRKFEISEIGEFVKERINSKPDFETEYFEIADEKELVPVNSKAGMEAGKQYYGFIAVKAGKVRLIDNIKMNWSEPKG